MLPSLLLLLLLLPAPALAGGTWEAEVVKVVDGDTIHVRRDSGELVKVRLWGVDCPELRNPWGPEAAEFTRVAALGRRVRVEVKGKPSRGRIVALVWIRKGVSLNHRLIWFGWAEWSRKYAPKEKAFQEAAARAQIKNMGVK